MQRYRSPTHAPGLGGEPAKTRQPPYYINLLRIFIVFTITIFIKIEQVTKAENFE